MMMRFLLIFLFLLSGCARGATADYESFEEASDAEDLDDDAGEDKTDASSSNGGPGKNDPDSPDAGMEDLEDLPEPDAGAPTDYPVLDEDAGSSPEEDAEGCEIVAWFPDADGDGAGDANASPVMACEAPDGFVSIAGDCRDDEVSISPLVAEVCNGIDDDCDGIVDLEECPCSFDSREGRVFLFCAERLSWAGALEACRSLGYDLASVRDIQENAWVSRRSSDFMLEDVWIGLNDIRDGGVFVWSNGDPSSFRFWNDGQPNNRNDQDCTEIHTQDDWALTWNDEECEEAQSFVCSTE